ncbi:glycosyltransferase family 2 protein [Psychrobacter sp. 72-O-c]|uniref:glycosyltransferase family 2 protein n=1 Tax=Psychrobacter sp. 72-O-c TaxID=2774125 RepID=UPI001919DA1B|nr:glycosyltransferase family 2 protein [Psychrobacter sp. 72-O-c]
MTLVTTNELTVNNPTATSTTIPVSVITTCDGRNRHLYNLLSSLAQSSVRPDEVIIVNDDADPEWLAQFPLNIVQIPTTAGALLESDFNTPKIDTDIETVLKTGFDIGRNRNSGAAHAKHDALIFLDVDCIVAPTFIEQLNAKLQAHPDALLMGQPRYLTRPLTDAEGAQLQQGKLPKENLDKLSVYNPYRYNFELVIDDGVAENDKQTPIEQTQDYGAFWSLCFAISQSKFEQIGGFDTHYVGYGAEDTDFAFTARALNIDFYLTADVIYHQQHSVYRPPLNHLDSIVVNANRFYDKWQHWPMAGWLTEFAYMALIHWQAEQTDPIGIIRQPSAVEIEAAHCPDAPYV